MTSRNWPGAQEVGPGVLWMDIINFIEHQRQIGLMTMKDQDKNNISLHNHV